VIIETPEPTPVASLDDIIASKEAAQRTKDLAALPVLCEVRDQIGGHENPTDRP
jgi:hypothetical protein